MKRLISLFIIISFVLGASAQTRKETTTSKVKSSKSVGTIEKDDDWSEVIFITSSKAAIMYDEYNGTYTKTNQYLRKGKYPICRRDGEMIVIGIDQESCGIKDKNYHTEIWRAVDGHGFVYPNYKSIVIRATPSKNGKKIVALPEPDDIPDCYECLGVSGNWYKILYEGKVGYMEKGSTTWIIHTTECAGCIR